MGRDSWRFRQAEKEREKKRQQNPMWRGIGCMFMVILTLTGYFVADWFLKANAANRWIYLPLDILRPPLPLPLPEGIILKLIVAFLFMLLSYGVISFVYAIVFPIRLEETDVPPLRRGDLPRRRR